MDEVEFELMEREIEMKLNTFIRYGETKQTGAQDLAAYRAAIEHRTRIACHDEIIALDGAAPGGGFAGYDEGMEIAADHIKPKDVQCNH